MSSRETVSPATLQVERTDEEIVVWYLDGRRTVYSQAPKPVESPVRIPPELLIQVLHVDADLEEGILIYVNDRDTAAEILEDTGVGRINLQPGEAASLLPGIEVEMDGHHGVVDVDLSTTDGRVFVFAEGALGALAYEVVEEA